MATAMIEPTDTEIAALIESLSPAEREAFRLDGELLAAEQASDAAAAEVNAAKAAVAAESTPASRSRAARAQREAAKLSEVEILAREAWQRAVTASEPHADPEIVLQRQIRSAMTSAAVAVGLYAQLQSLASRAGLAPIGPAHADALAGFAKATQALTQQQGAAWGPKPSSDREVTR